MLSAAVIGETFAAAPVSGTWKHSLPQFRRFVALLRVLGDSCATDGLLHALIFAPQSALRMRWFLLISRVLPNIGTGRSLPSFVGHIKSESVHIKRPSPFSVRIDGETQSVGDLFHTLRESAQTSESYLILIVLSTLLATFERAILDRRVRLEARIALVR